MTTTDIFTKFLRLYPEFQDKVRDYADLESNSILINLHDGDAFEFIFDDDDHYTLALYANPYKPRKSRKPCLLRIISMIIVIALLGLIGWGVYIGAKSYTGNDIFIETTEEPTTEEIPETTMDIEPVTTEPTTEPPTEPETEPTTKPALVPIETIPTIPTAPTTEPVETPETTESNSDISEDDVELLAIAIYQEAGADACCDDCRRRICDIVLNRVDSEYFPDTIYEVLTQRSQYGVFYWTGVVWPERASYSGEAHAVERARRIAREVLEGNHSDLYGKGYIWQAGFVQGDPNQGFWHCGIYFGRN